MNKVADKTQVRAFTIIAGLPWPVLPAARNWGQPSNPRTYFIAGLRGSVDSLRLGHQVMFYPVKLGRIGHVGRAVGFGRSVPTNTYHPDARG